MALSLQIVVAVVRVGYLVILTAVAMYSLHRTHYYSLPIPTSLSALTVALPIVTGFSGETLVAAASRNDGPRKPQRKWTSIAFATLLVYEAAVATLAGTYLAPPKSLRCMLDEKWQIMWSRKDATAITAIQDEFKCCGLHSAIDRAWPFPNRDTPVDTCRTQFNRPNGCFGAWREAEQVTAGLLLLVAVLVFVWQVLVLVRTSQYTSWFHGFQHTDNDVEDNPRGRRALGFRQVEDRYTDNLEREDGEGDDEDEQPINAIANGTEHSQTALNPQPNRLV